MAVTQGFRIEAMNPAHNRKGFASGVEPLVRYFRELVTQDVKRRVTNCFVTLDAAARGRRSMRMKSLLRSAKAKGLSSCRSVCRQLKIGWRGTISRDYGALYRLAWQRNRALFR